MVTKYIKSMRWHSVAIAMLSIALVCESVTSCTTNKVIVERVEFLRIDVADLKARVIESEELREETLERLLFLERSIEEIIFN